MGRGKSVQAKYMGYKIDINSSMDCQNQNKVYLLGCKKSPRQYIGKTQRMMKKRFSKHRGHVNTKNLSKTTGAHFNENGYSMEITIIEKLFREDQQFSKQRAKMYIKKFNTRYRGD